MRDAPCTPGASRWSRAIVSLGRRSRPKKGNSLREESRRIRKVARDRSIARECRLWRALCQSGSSEEIKARRTADLYGRFEFEEDRLVDEDLPRFRAQEFDLIFLQLDLLSRSVASYCAGISTVVLVDEQRMDAPSNSLSMTESRSISCPPSAMIKSFGRCWFVRRRDGSVDAEREGESVLFSVKQDCKRGRHDGPEQGSS